MKSLKIAFALAILTGLLGGLVPNGVCQLIAEVKAESCEMPCCKRAAQPVSCPLIRPDIPHDAIAASTFKWVPSLEPVAVLTVEEAPAGHALAVAQRQPQIPRNFFCSTPQSIPAPPSLA